jgi:hypothetical protein
MVTYFSAEFLLRSSGKRGSVRYKFKTKFDVNCLMGKGRLYCLSSLSDLVEVPTVIVAST